MSEYTLTVVRRDRDDAGYDALPWVATACKGTELIAAQFGATATEAFRKALRYVEEDRERVPIEVTIRG